MAQSQIHSRAEEAGALSRSSDEVSQMLREGRSFSGNERNCCFLNTGVAAAAGGRFANISAASGLDFPDDGRAVALVDWDHDGDLDMWISNRNAPRLRLMRNEAPGSNHFLALRLEGNGKTTSRDAIGARVEVVVRGEKLEVRGQETEIRDRESGIGSQRPDTTNPQSEIRNPKSIKTLRAGEGFLAQSSKWLHFGLGAADVIQRVIVHWPGGETEEFSAVLADHRYRLVQGSGTVQDITLPGRETILAASTQKIPRSSQVARIPMVQLLTVPATSYVGFDGQLRPLPTKTGSPVLVNLWASWCAPCVAELNELARRHDEIRAKGIEIVALAVDGLEGNTSETSAAARLVSSSKFPFTVGQATLELVQLFQILHNHQFAIHRQLPLPTSFLIDQQGRLAVIYKGPLSIDKLLEDVDHSGGNRIERFARSAAIAGTPISHPRIERTAVNVAASLRFLLATDLQKSGRAEQAAAQYFEVLEFRPDSDKAHNNLGNALESMGRIEEALGHYQEALRIKPDNALTHNNLGNAMLAMGRVEQALAHFQDALRITPDYAEAHNNLGAALHRGGHVGKAMTHYREALRIKPDYTDAHVNWANALHGLGRMDEAVAHYRQALRISPNLASAHNNLGTILARQGQLAAAVKHFEHAVRLKPDYDNAQKNLSAVRSLLQQRNVPTQP